MFSVSLPFFAVLLARVLSQPLSLDQHDALMTVYDSLGTSTCTKIVQIGSSLPSLRRSFLTLFQVVATSLVHVLGLTHPALRWD